MPKQSAPAGKYILTGVMWRQKHEDGSDTVWETGDVVDLTAAEATRLVGRKHSCFKPAPESTNSNGTDTSLDSGNDDTGGTTTVIDKR